jgi:outer membrane protein OmpA-like peptidoglycan-associated protein
MRSLFVLAIAGLVSVVCGTASADPAYTAKEIVEHFAPGGQLGATRGICIGTETECGTEGADSTAAAVASYDLLITFDLDSDSLTNEAKENLNEFAKALQNPTLAAATFAVDGHTDARGTEDYNYGLSERRAQAVINYLSQLGVDASRLVAKGFGKTKPRTADPFDPVNRRVEARLVAQ